MNVSLKEYEQLFSNKDWCQFVTRDEDNVEYIKTFLWYTERVIDADISYLLENRFDLTSEQLKVFIGKASESIWDREAENGTAVLLKRLSTVEGLTDEYVSEKRDLLTYLESLLYDMHKASDDMCMLVDFENDPPYIDLSSEERKRCLKEFKLYRIPQIHFIRHNITRIFQHVKNMEPDFFEPIGNGPSGTENCTGLIGKVLEEIHGKHDIYVQDNDNFQQQVTYDPQLPLPATAN